MIVARRVPALKHSGALAHLKLCMLMFLSLCLCSFLNYTSEGDYILFGSGRIASAQSRRKGLSGPLASAHVVRRWTVDSVVKGSMEKVEEEDKKILEAVCVVLKSLSR